MARQLHTSLLIRNLLFLWVMLFPVVGTSQVVERTAPTHPVQEQLFQGLFNTDRSRVNCDSIVDRIHDDFVNAKTPTLLRELIAVYQLDSLEPPLTYDFVRGDKTAYAVSIGVCDKQYRGKGKKLILIGEDLATNAKSDIEKQLILVAVLAHEIAHFKQQALQMKLVDKEVELHADFMAGWYLARYVSKLNLERDQKLRSVMTALSTFYYFGQDEKPSVLYGTPENRLQISLSGYQERISDVAAVYSKGINVIKENPIYWNLPDEVGTRIKESLLTTTGQEDSLDILGVHCPGRILIGDNKTVQRVFSCRLSVPTNLGTDHTYQTSDEVYNAINKGFVSYLPPNTKKRPGSEITHFDVLDSPSRIRSVDTTKLNREIAIGIIFGIPFHELPVKTETTPTASEAQVLERQIFDLAKKSRTLKIPSITLLERNCLVSTKLDGTRVIACENARGDFERRKSILYSLIPKGFHVLKLPYGLLAWNPEEKDVEDVQYSKRQYLHSPIKFISLIKPDDRVPHLVDSSEGKLVISVVSGATIGTLVTEKRALNPIGEEFYKQVTSMSRSEKQLPSFTFRGTACDVDELDNYTWVVECQMKPDLERNETIDSIFDLIRNGIASSAPRGWEEDESEETYQLTQPEFITEVPTVSAVTVRKTKAFLQLHFYVNERNSRVQYGIANARPNQLGRELLSQINKLTKLDIDTVPSFELFNQKCRVEYVPETYANHVSCTLLGSKEANAKVFNQLKEAVISLLPQNWRYRIAENSVDAERMSTFKCPAGLGQGIDMCLPVTIYFSIRENGTIYFNLDFDNDPALLKKI